MITIITAGTVDFSYNITVNIGAKMGQLTRSKNEISAVAVEHGVSVKTDKQINEEASDRRRDYRRRRGSASHVYKKKRNTY